MEPQISRLQNRRILLGISGGIAAYKSADLARKLREAGAELRVMMSPSAIKFITPLTMQTLSGNPVHTEFFDPESEFTMGHIELARWADLILIAPATADFLARLATGRADDLLTAVCLASEAHLCTAPAMNRQMWLNSATQKNCQILKKRKIQLFGPASGEQACGEVGPGRMLESVELCAAVETCFATRRLEGLCLLLDAGPTQEALDPVRYLSNHSSGRMGFALAGAAADFGAHTVLVAGPSALPTPEHVQRIDVRSAQQMYRAVMERAAECDIFIAAAAVADYRPLHTEKMKISGKQEELVLQLTPNPDIIAAVAALRPAPFTVAFAAETDNTLQKARAKLKSKGVDMVVVNDVSRTDIGFYSEENEVSILWNGGQTDLPKASKQQLAVQILEKAAELREKNRCTVYENC